MTGGVVVVLGRTGRNFAAGMSGGVAFVLDELDKFQSRCNLGMVELEKVSASADKKLLHEMVTSHFMHTGSRNAKRILDAWDGLLPKFVKVMPVDYKRVLAERKKKSAAKA
jgi:glutamate synthase (NADPH/NADH) large chain/glutamate synthase (ferredoxin)